MDAEQRLVEISQRVEELEIIFSLCEEDKDQDVLTSIDCELSLLLSELNCSDKCQLYLT